MTQVFTSDKGKPYCVHGAYHASHGKATFFIVTPMETPGMPLLAKTQSPLYDWERRYEAERSVLEMLTSHEFPGVVRLEDTVRKDCTLILDMAWGGSLADLMRYPLSHGFSVLVVASVAHTLACMEQVDIHHGDLSPGNILLTGTAALYAQGYRSSLGAVLRSGATTLIDFEFSRYQGSSAFHKPREHLDVAVGTPPYMAPEVWRNTFSPKSDVFSLGVILYKLLYDTHPFLDAGHMRNVTMMDFGNAILGVRTPEISSDCGRARHLLTGMLEKAPENRPSANDVFQECLGLLQITEETFTRLRAYSLLLSQGQQRNSH